MCMIQNIANILFVLYYVQTAFRRSYRYKVYDSRSHKFNCHNTSSYRFVLLATMFALFFCLLVTLPSRTGVGSVPLWSRWLHIVMEPLAATGNIRNQNWYFVRDTEGGPLSVLVV